MSDQTNPTKRVIYTKEIPDITRKRMKIAAMWLGKSMKDFMIQAIENEIERNNIPSAVLTAPEEKDWTNVYQNQREPFWLH